VAITGLVTGVVVPCACRSANNTYIAAFTATDVDGGVLTFQLQSTASPCGPFRINATGALFFGSTAGTLLNFEGTALYTCTVQVTDPTSRSDTQAFNVTVVDVNEAPTFSALPTGYSVDEEAVNYTTVVPSSGGSFIVVTDEDAGNLTSLVIAVRSSAVGFSSSYFEVVRASDNGTCRGGDNCILRVVLNRPAMDYDAGMRVVHVSLTVTDSNGAFTTASNFTVVVDDINQGALRAVFGAFFRALKSVVAASCHRDRGAVATSSFLLRCSTVLHAVPDEHDDPREQV
jgi:hypothetical protein